MNVIEAARAIGLAGDGEVRGTIEEDVVLSVIAQLAAANPGHDDLFEAAAERVRRARSAGVVHAEEGSLIRRDRGGSSRQLRYRSEMATVFIDLAIDLGLRQVERLADSTVD